MRSLDGVSFAIRQGEVMGLVGESGCGKSTLARVLLRLLPADSGSVVIGGRNLSTLRGEELRRFRTSIQLIFQNPYAALDPRMRIGTSLEAPLAQHGRGSQRERRRRAIDMLREVGLDDSFIGRLPSQCSGGELQRIVIARALLLEPRFLVCDEPTSALDAPLRAQIINLLVDLKRRFDLTLLVISHDLRVVRYISDRVAVMYLGRIVEFGERDDVFDNPLHPVHASADRGIAARRERARRGGRRARRTPESAESSPWLQLPSEVRDRAVTLLGRGARARRAARGPPDSLLLPGTACARLSAREQRARRRRRHRVANA